MTIKLKLGHEVMTRGVAYDTIKVYGHQLTVRLV